MSVAFDFGVGVARVGRTLLSDALDVAFASTLLLTVIASVETQWSHRGSQV